MESISIRKISLEDFAAFRSLRLLALHTNPEAFGRTYDEEKADFENIWRPRLDPQTAPPDNFMLLAFDGENPVGMASFVRMDPPKVRHKGMIWGMFVHPAYRRKGLGRKLLRATLDRAFGQAGLAQINLSVLGRQEAAKQMYLLEGFEPFGLEKNSVFQNGAYDDEIMMVKFR